MIQQRPYGGVSMVEDHNKVLEQKRRYRIKYREQLRIKQREYYNINKKTILPKQKAYHKQYRIEHKEKELQRKRLYRLLHKDKLNKRARERSKSKEFKDKIYAREKNRTMNDIKYAMSRRLRHRVYLAFRDYTDTGKVKKADEYGINYKAIVEKLFREMPYDFDENKYHIDHIIPLCSFDLTNLEQIKLAFCPQNHRWLSAEDNIKKIKDDIKLSIWRIK